ncbi:CD99 antigen-like protein 2 isoform 2-T2 [Discoglossus pictus]
MITWRVPALFCLAFVAVGIRGQELDLSDAFDDVTTKSAVPAATKAPTPAPKPNPDAVVTNKPAPKPQPGDGGDTGDDGFNLEDAFGGEVVTNKPAPKPQPGDGGNTGGKEISDDDLFDGKPLPPDDHPHDQPGADDQNAGEQKQGVVAGIVSAVGVAVLGAASSFIAYQKKKLCFKEAGDDPENVNMESHKGDQAEPQVQSTLLSK